MTRLFPVEPEPKKPRAKPLKLMHVIDAGPGIDSQDMCLFQCKRCKNKSDWMLCRVSEAKRGIPCPVCNSSR